MSFPAFKGLEEFCNKEGKVVNLCTLPAELLLQQGITEYYAPVIPRGSMFKTAQEIMDRIGITNQSKNRQRYITSLLEIGVIERTIPDKPNDPHQKYRCKK